MSFFDKVSGKKIVLAAACLLLLTGCSLRLKPAEQPVRQIPDESSIHRQAVPESIPPQEPETVPERIPAQETVPAENTAARNDSSAEERALLIYMVGSDLESEHGFASADIEEILGCGASEDGFRIYICTGGSPFWWNADIPADSCTVSELREGKIHELASLPDGSMADPSTLTWFIDQVETNPENRQLSLILWNHGGGIVLGYGADANYDFDLMSVPQLQNALKNTAFCKSGGRFCYVGFDACLMAMIEVADLLQDVCDYMIASEEVEPGTGWDYACVKELSRPENADGRAAGEILAKAYAQSVRESSPYEIDYTVSVMDLAGTDAVIRALGQLTDVMEENLSDVSYTKYFRFRQNSRSFGSRSNSAFDSMDLLDFARSADGLHPEEAGELQKALDDFVVFNETNMGRAGGVAVYFPFLNKEESGDRLTDYESLGFCRPYTEFICSFNDILSGGSPVRWDVTNDIPTVLDGSLFLQLGEEETEDFSEAYSMIWEDLHENGEYRCWYKGGSADLSEDGKLYSSFDGRMFQLVDDTTGDYAPIMVMETDRTENSVTYRTVLSIIRTPEVPLAYRKTAPGALIAAAWEFYLVDAYFTVDSTHPDGQITGMYLLSASKAGYPDFLPAASDFTLQEGDIVQCFQLCRRITYYDDGSVRPFSEWENMGTYRGFDFTAGGSSVSLRTVPYEEDTDLYCVFSITDTRRNSYMSDLVPMDPGPDT